MRWWRSQRPVIVAYAGATIVCLLILTAGMQLWRSRLAVPFSYGGGDDFFYLMLSKGVRDNGWVLTNRFLGMPTGLDLRAFPVTENGQLLVMKFISYWTASCGLIFNLYYLLTFPATVVTSLFVFRRFDISLPSAVVGSLLYSFLPYHFIRGQGHIFLSGYYLVPLTVMVSLWICLGIPLFHSEDDDGSVKWRISDRRTIGSIVVCALVASGGAYYAFFGGFFLCVAGAIALCHRRYRQAGAAGILLVVLFSVFVMNVTPNILYDYRHGSSTHERSAGEVEVYGLKITQLLLPVRGHVVGALARFSETYAQRVPFVNENQSASLGVIGGVGFLVLIGLLGYRGRLGHDEALFRNLSVLNIYGLVLATVGGIGVLFALLVSPQFRAINRMSVFIGFLSIFAVVLLLERLARKWARSKTGRWLCYGVLGVLVVVGVADQRVFGFVPPYGHNWREYRSDAAFIRRIEGEVPRGAMIFQLPYVAFPESVLVHRMNPYDHLRGYFHSTGLRWSFGAMKGREGDAWQQGVAAMPPRELVASLVAAGFSGIYLDRYGYADQGKAVESDLSMVLGMTPVVSPNQRLVFYGFEHARNLAELSRSKPVRSARWSVSRLGGLITARPAAAVADGELQVMVRGGDDGLYHAVLRAEKWTPWKGLGGSTRTAPAAVEFSGAVWLFVRGPEGSVSVNRMTHQGWSGWEEVWREGLTPSAPAAVAFGDRLYVVVRSMNGRVLLNDGDGKRYVGWRAVPGEMLTAWAPGAASFAGSLYVFVRGLDDRVFLNRFDGAQWSGWSAVPGEMLTASTPRAVSVGDTIYVFVRGMNDSTFMNRFNGGQWSGWSAVPGDSVTTSGPEAVAIAGGLALLIRKPDNEVGVHRLEVDADAPSNR